MKQRYKISPYIIRKFKDDICFMVDTDFTYIELVEPRIAYVEPLGYDMTEEKVEWYVEVILKSARGDDFNSLEPMRKLCKKLLKFNLRNLQRIRW